MQINVFTYVFPFISNFRLSFCIIDKLHPPQKRLELSKQMTRTHAISSRIQKNYDRAYMQ